MFQSALCPGSDWRRRLGWVFGLVLAMLVACEQQATTQQPSASASALPSELSPEVAAQVLAQVGERTITLGEYAAVLQRMDPFERLRYQSPERRRLLLDEMIRVELLAGEARRRGLDKEPRTVGRIRQALRDELLRRRRAQLPGPEDIPEGEVRAYYEEHKGDFREPERRRVAAIVLTSKAEAQVVLAQAVRASPSDWGRLVRQHSLHKPAAGETSQPLELAGDLGIVSAGQASRGGQGRVPDPVRKAVFEVDEIGGVYAQVVEAEGKFYVVRMIGKTEARVRSFADAQRSIRVTLVQNRIREAEKKLEAELRKRFAVRIDEAALARVQVPTAADGGVAGDATAPAH